MSSQNDESLSSPNNSTNKSETSGEESMSQTKPGVTNTAKDRTASVSQNSLREFLINLVQALRQEMFMPGLVTSMCLKISA